MRFFTGRNFISNKKQQNYNQKQRIHNSYIVSDFCKTKTVYHMFDASLRSLAICKDRIPEINLDVNRNGSIDPSCGSMNTRANHTAERLTNNSDKITNHALTRLVYNKNILLSKGQIDDLKIFNYGLTANQVKTLYNSGAARFAPSTGAP